MNEDAKCSNPCGAEPMGCPACGGDVSEGEPTKCRKCGQDFGYGMNHGICDDCLDRMLDDDYDF